MTAKLIDPATAAGAKITIGRRWWLETIEDMRRADGAKGIGNILEADILVELADGRRILIDTKFYPHGMNVHERIVDQLEKVSSGIDEGLIHGGEFWMSDSIEELHDLFELHTEMTGKGRIRLEQNVVAKGFPEDFFEMERRVATVDRRGTILILDAEKAKDAVITQVANKFADRILVPTPPSLGYRIPMATQAATIIGRAAVRDDGTNSSIPVNPLGTNAVVTVTAAPAQDPGNTPVSQVLLLRAQRGSSLATRLAAGQPIEVTEAELTQLTTANQVCGLSRDFTQTAVACLSRSVPLDDPTGAQYMVLVQRHANRGTGRLFVQAVLYDSNGRTLRAYPATPDALELRAGRAVVIPFSTKLREGPAAFPYDVGTYNWGLRLTGGDGRTVVNPGALPMAVQSR